MGALGRVCTYLGCLIVTMHGASTLMAVRADTPVPAPSVIPGVNAGDPSVNGTLLLITGLSSLFLPTLVTIFNRILDDRNKERLAKFERHELLNRVQALEAEKANIAEEAKAAVDAAKERIVWLEQMVTENRALIEKLSDPYATHVLATTPPDPEAPPDAH